MMFSAVAAAGQLTSDVGVRMRKQIKLKIFPDGQVQAEVLGFRGKKCTDYISILEELLDAEAIDSERTPEYYLEETEVIQSPQIKTVRQG
jgi:hypothetical protein